MPATFRSVPLHTFSQSSGSASSPAPPSLTSNAASNVSDGNFSVDASSAAVPVGVLDTLSEVVSDISPKITPAVEDPPSAAVAEASHFTEDSRDDLPLVPFTPSAAPLGPAVDSRDRPIHLKKGFKKKPAAYRVDKWDEATTRMVELLPIFCPKAQDLLRIHESKKKAAAENKEYDYTKQKLACFYREKHGYISFARWFY